MNELAGSRVHDHGPGRFDGTISGSSISRTRERYGSSLSFAPSSANSDRVTVGTVPAGNRLSLPNDVGTFIWRAKPASDGSPTSNPRIASKSDDGTTTRAWDLWLTTDSGVFWACNFAGQSHGGPTGVTLGEWHNPAIVKDADSAVRFYYDPGTGLDGEETSGIQTIPDVNANLTIGNLAWLNRNWDGLFEYLFVFDRVLSYAEIEEVRRAPYALFAPAPRGVRSYAFKPAPPAAAPPRRSVVMTIFT